VCRREKQGWFCYGNVSLEIAFFCLLLHFDLSSDPQFFSSLQGRSRPSNGVLGPSWNFLKDHALGAPKGRLQFPLKRTIPIAHDETATQVVGLFWDIDCRLLYRLLLSCAHVGGRQASQVSARVRRRPQGMKPFTVIRIGEGTLLEPLMTSRIIPSQSVCL
jgi:hypothetical protein